MRALAMAYRAIAAAVATLRDSAFPHIGIAMVSLQRAISSPLKPWASLPRQINSGEAATESEAVKAGRYVSAAPDRPTRQPLFSALTPAKEPKEAPE